MKSKIYLHSLTLAVIAIVSGSFPARGDVLYQSATLGPIGQASGYVLASYVFLGSRFSLSGPVQVDAIGGHMYGNYGTLFGAIFSLSGPNALPSGSPFDSTPLASVAFTPPVIGDTDVSVPLSVELQPGNYAILFGSGQFGADGVGAMPTDNSDIPGQASYFGWWDNQWHNGGFNSVRFAVYGEPVPEPGIIALFAIGFGVIALRKFRHRRQLL
jgi:hypothetical protein